MASLEYNRFKGHASRAAHNIAHGRPAHPVTVNELGAIVLEPRPYCWVGPQRFDEAAGEWRAVSKDHMWALLDANYDNAGSVMYRLKNHGLVVCIAGIRYRWTWGDEKPEPAPAPQPAPLTEDEERLLMEAVMDADGEPEWCAVDGAGWPA